MKTCVVYFILEYKKSVKVLLKSAASLLFMAVLLLAGAVVLSHVFFSARMFQAIDVGVAVPEGEKETKAAVYFHGVYSVFGKGMQGAVFLLSANVLMVLCVLRRVHSFGIPAGMGCAAWTVSAAEFSAQILCGIVFRACSVKERLLLGLQIFPAFFSQR